MFDLIIMLSRYLFIFYIVLFLWQGIVYVAYEQGGFLGNPIYGGFHAETDYGIDAHDGVSDSGIQQRNIYV